MRIILFVLCLLFPVIAWGDPVTFSVVQTQVTLPPGFAPGWNGQTQSADGKWQYFSHTNGAALRLMPASGTLAVDQYGYHGFAWAALINTNPFEGVLKLDVTLKVCQGTNCTNVLFSGQLRYSPQGLVWSLPPSATTITLGDQLIYLDVYTNTARGAVSTLDAGVRATPTTPTPEPTTLALLGAGLLGIAGFIRKRGQR